MLSGKSSAVSSRSSGASSNVGEPPVSQAEHAAHRETINDRLGAIVTSAANRGGIFENIEDGTAENRGRLKTIEGMPGRLRNGPDNIQVNGGADEPSSDLGQQNGAASARGSTANKLGLKDHGLEEPQHSSLLAPLRKYAKYLSLVEGLTERCIK